MCLVVVFRAWLAVVVLKCAVVVLHDVVELLVGWCVEVVYWQKVVPRIRKQQSLSLEIAFGCTYAK